MTSATETLWAQLAELDRTDTANAYEKADRARRIILAENLTSREFARDARRRGIEGMAHGVTVARLCYWADLVDVARAQKVLPRGSTPAEGTLRPLFAPHVPADARVELLAQALEDSNGEGITAAAIRKVVKEQYPKPVKPQRKLSARMRAVLPQLRKLEAEHGLDALAAGLAQLGMAEQHRIEAQRKKRPAKEDK